MLLQALAAYADSDLAADLADESFETKPVPYAVEIDERGRFLGITPRFEEQRVEGGKKPKTNRVMQTLLIPKSPVNRNSGVYPLLGVDSIQYVVGPEPDAWTKPGEHDKHAKQHAGFIELLREAAELAGDPWLKAAVRLYEDPAQVAAARAGLAAEKAPGGANVALFINPDLSSDDVRGALVSRPAVKAFWRRHYEKQSGARHAKGGEGVCMISGRLGPIAVTHDKIKGASSLGGQAAGVALMSFDKQAFCSYGWEQNQNGPVSPERATAYVLALNDLMKPGRHRQGRDRERLARTRTDLGSMAFLYWTREPSVDVLDCVDPPPELGPDADMLVADMLDTPWTGQSPEGVPANWFYLLVVSGNGGRLVVHDWRAESLAEVQQNIRHWRAKLQVPDVFKQGQLSRPPAVYWLLRALMPPGMKEDHKQVGHWKMALVRRALFGPRFPLGLSILGMALDRLRRAQGAERLSPTRAGLIRLCVDDLLRMKTKGDTDLDGDLSLNLNHPAALCGRLMAIYEILQYQAHKLRNQEGKEEGEKKNGQVGVTVTDRYFALASTYPLLAFPKLEDLSRAHLKKLRRDNQGAHWAIKSRIDELTAQLMAHSGHYPARLSIEDQGRFAVAYHWQMAEDARDRQAFKQQNEEKAAEAALASAGQ